MHLRCSDEGIQVETDPSRTNSLRFSRKTTRYGPLDCATADALLGLLSHAARGGCGGKEEGGGDEAVWGVSRGALLLGGA
jgi:hypothetical protein